MMLEELCDLSVFHSLRVKKSGVEWSNESGEVSGGEVSIGVYGANMHTSTSSCAFMSYSCIFLSHTMVNCWNSSM